MSGNFILPSIVAKESLAILSNNLVIGNLVYKGDAENFRGAKAGDTITIRRPASFAVNEFSTTITTQDVNETSVPLTLEKHFDISVGLTTKQLTLSLNDFSAQVVEPAMVNMAEAIDTYIYSKYVEINEIEGDGTLSTVSDLAGVDRKLMELKVPMGNRIGFVGPLTKQRFLSIDNLNRLDTRGDEGLTGLREASMGRVMGIDWYGAQGVRSHVIGVPAGTPTATGTLGATSVAIAAGGAAGTYKKGDIVTFANHTQTYTVTADVVLNGSGAGTLNVLPVLASAVPGGTAVALRAAHFGNIVGNPRGLSFVSVPLEMPMETMGASTLSYNGINIRVVYGYDFSTKKNTISFDCIVGAKVTDPRLLVRYDG